MVVPKNPILKPPVELTCIIVELDEAALHVDLKKQQGKQVGPFRVIDSGVS